MLNSGMLNTGYLLYIMFFTKLRGPIRVKPGARFKKKKQLFRVYFCVVHELSTIYFFQLFSKFEFEKCNRRVRHTFPTTHEGFSRHQCQLIPSHLGSRKKWTNAGCHQSWLKQEGQWQKATCIFFKTETRTKGEVRFPELEDVNMNIPILIFGAGREKTTLLFGKVVWGKNSGATVVIKIRKLKKEKERTSNCV